MTMADKDVPDNQIVRFGDSITAGMNVTDTVNMGIGCDTWETALHRAWMVTSVRPKHVFIMLGINDLQLEHSVQEVTKNARKLLDYIRVVAKCRFTVHSVITNEPRLSHRVHRLNKALQAIVSTGGSFVTVATRPDYFAPDRIHLSATGNAALSSTLYK